MIHDNCSVANPPSPLFFISYILSKNPILKKFRPSGRYEPGRPLQAAQEFAETRVQ
jgi:hypothetical protein